MRIFADTNWLAANYFSADSHRTSIVARFIQRWDQPWHIAPIILLECENLFASLAGSANSEEWRMLQSHLGSRLIQANGEWGAIVQRTQALLRAHSPKARLGVGDLMLLATALENRATHFLSFDSNSNLRALASVLKLKVYPDLTAEDRRRAQLFR